MNLDERVDAAIRAHADELQPRVPDLATIRAGARAQSRRRAGLGIAAFVVAVVVAWTAVVNDLADQRSLPPAVDPHEPKVVQIPSTRTEQVVVEPEVTSDLVPGEALGETVTTDDPGYDGDGSLELVFGDTARVRMAATCQGAPDAWYVFSSSPARSGSTRDVVMAR